MKSVANYLIAMLMFMYWVFRVVVEYMYQTGREFIATPISSISEIVILFISLICIVLVVKRIMFGGIIYAVAYFGYFGVDLYQKLTPVINWESLNMNASMDIVCSGAAVVLAIIVVIDVASSQIKPVENKQTSWFYDNKEFDRRHDSRDDRNQYKF